MFDLSDCLPAERHDLRQAGGVLDDRLGEGLHEDWLLLFYLFGRHFNDDLKAALAQRVLRLWRRCRLLK